MNGPFRIITAVSTPYAEALRIFMPSWVKNAGASEIRMATFGPLSYEEFQLRRWKYLTDEVAAGVRDGVAILWLDADCFVLQNLGDGFSAKHPMSVSRWPHINAGVMFFNTRYEYPLNGWMDETGDKILTMLDNPGTCDQWAIEDGLMRIERSVCKLDWMEWNYCDGVWDDELPAVADTVRIIHVKGQGEWDKPFARGRIETVQRIFAGKI